jgi:hypothetical protein
MKRWILVSILFGLVVPKPKWSDMILKCNDKNGDCYWSCEWGTITVPEIIEGSEILISTGCVKEKPSCPTINYNGGLMYNITPTMNEL